MKQETDWNYERYRTRDLLLGYEDNIMPPPPGGIPSPGKDGRGISDVVLNQDYTLTFYFTDGTEYTTRPLQIQSAETELIKNTFGDASNNLLPFIENTITVNGVTCNYKNGIFTFNGTANANGGRTNHIIEFTLPQGTYFISRSEAIELSPYIQDSNNTKLTAITQNGNSFTLDSETTVNIGVNVTLDTVYTNAQAHIMLVSGTSIQEWSAPIISAKDIIARKYTPLKWANKTWCCIGDSLTEENHTTTKHYFDYISEHTGINIINMGNGGSGYYKEYNIGTCFFQRIQNDFPTSGVDVVTIFGSGNDLNPNDGSGRGWSQTLGSPTDKLAETYGNGEYPTICACINGAINAIHNKMPLVPIIIVSPTPWASAWNAEEERLANENDTVTILKKWYTYTNALQTICKNRGIMYLDLYHNSSLRPWEQNYRESCYSKDLDQSGNPIGTHPDEVGHAILAPLFEASLDSAIRFDN